MSKRGPRLLLQTRGLLVPAIVAVGDAQGLVPSILITFGDRVDSLCVARAALLLAKAVAKELDRLSARVLRDGTTEGPSF
jgi:hypothetical protein